MLQTKAAQGDSQWQVEINRNILGQEIERNLPGGVVSRWQRDKIGRPIHHSVSAHEKSTMQKKYYWDVNDRLQAIYDELAGSMTRFSHDMFGHLAAAEYQDGSWDYKLPDEIGNLFKNKEKTDQKYGKAGQLLQDDTYTYRYDALGNLTEKESLTETWQYFWTQNGMLASVKRPDNKIVAYTYDALGRRLTKTYNEQTTHYVWDGNVLLHEWVIQAGKTITGVNEAGELVTEIPEDLITWIFEEGSFVPQAKLQNGTSYSIITDHLGTPVEAYDQQGKKVWTSELDIYGKQRKFTGDKTFIPFRYQGMYFDEETELCYNRFRYYSPDTGTYISKDPIGLFGNNPNLYAYVEDCNSKVDVFGLSSFDPFSVGEITKFPKDLHFGQDRIAPNFSSIGSQADDAIVGRPISDVATDIKVGNIDPDVMVISYTVDPTTGKNVTLNNRGLAAIAESGKTPSMAIKVPFDKVPPHLVADIQNRPPSKTIAVTKNKNGSGFIRNITNGCA